MDQAVKYKDKTGCSISAIFFEDKVQYKKEGAKYNKVVSYIKFLTIINKMGWIKA